MTLIQNLEHMKKSLLYCIMMTLTWSIHGQVITISSAPSSGGGWSYSGGVLTATSDVVINTSVVEGYLGTDDLEIKTSSTIKIVSPVVAPVNSGQVKELRLKAGADIIIESTGSITASAGRLNLVCWSRSTGGASGAVWTQQGSSIDTKGGDLVMSGGLNMLSDYSLGNPAGSTENNALFSGVTINGTVRTGYGSIQIRGRGNSTAAFAQGVSVGGTLTTTSGNISVWGMGKNMSEGILIGNPALSGAPGELISGSGVITLTGVGRTGSNGIRLGTTGCTITTGGNLNMFSVGNISGNTALFDIGGATLLSAGQDDILMNNRSNTFSYLLSVTDAYDIDIASATGLRIGKIITTGKIKISTETGDVQITDNISTSDNSTSALVIYAARPRVAGDKTGGNIIISGSPSVSTGSGGRAILYSGGFDESTGLSNLAAPANYRFGKDAAAATFTPALSDLGLYIIYRDCRLPSIQCPAPVTLGAPVDQCDIIYTPVAATASDYCTSLLVAQVSGPLPGSSFQVGTHILTYSATNINGTSTCTAIISVIDTIAPAARCKNVSKRFNAEGKVKIYRSDFDNGSSDNCSSSLTFSPDSILFTCSDVTQDNIVKKVEVTVSDYSANKTRCNFEVSLMNVPITLERIGGDTVCSDAGTQIFIGKVDGKLLTSKTQFKIFPETDAFKVRTGGRAELVLDSLESADYYAVFFTYRFEENCPLASAEDSIVIVNAPVADLKQTVVKCMPPGNEISLSLMFDGGNSPGGVFSLLNPSSGGSIIGSTDTAFIKMPDKAVCYNINYEALNPYKCPIDTAQRIYADDNDLIVVPQPSPSFIVEPLSNTVKDTFFICQVGGSVGFNIRRTSNGPSPVLKIRSGASEVASSFGTIELQAPSVSEVGARVYEICLTEGNALLPSCGSTLGSILDSCTVSFCKVVTIYNDGNNCGVNSPFESECPPDIDLYTPCDVDVNESLSLSCQYFTLNGPQIVEAQVEPVGVLTCADDEVELEWDGDFAGLLKNFASGGPELQDINVATKVICKIITFKICIPFPFKKICWDPIPLGRYEDYCDKTIGAIVQDLLNSLINGDGGGGVVIADTDSDGSWDYAAIDYSGFPAGSNTLGKAVIPNNISTPKGTMTIRHVTGWPFKPVDVCGSVNSQSVNLLELLPIGAIPLVGAMIEDLLESAQCNTELVFSDEETIEIPAVNTVSPDFASCNTTGYVFSEDLGCNTEAGWSVPVAFDPCYGGTLPYVGRLDATDATHYAGTTPLDIPVDTIFRSGVYQTRGPIPGSELDPGEYIVTYEAYSCAGAKSECSFTVKVTTGDPVLECPPNITVNTDVDLCESTVTGLTPLQGIGCATILDYKVHFDNTSGLSDTKVEIGFSQSNIGLHYEASGLAFPRGSNIVTYRMQTDINGDGTVTTGSHELQSCSFEVYVEDRQRPLALCQDIEVRLDNTGGATVYATDQLNGSPYLDGGSSDACDTDLTIEIARPGGSYSEAIAYHCTDVGINYVNLRAIDNDGNERTCVASVKVIDFFDGMKIALDLPELCLEANNPKQFDFSNYLVITLPDGTTLNHNDVANNSYLGEAAGGFGISAFAYDPSTSDTVCGTITPDGLYSPGTGTGYVTISYLLALPGATVPQNGNIALAGCFEVEHATFELRQPITMDSPECECLDGDERIVDLGVVKGGLEPYRIQYSGVRLDLNGDGIDEDSDGIYTYDEAHGHNIGDFEEDLGELRVVYTTPVWSFTVVDARGCETFRSGSCDNDDLTEGPAIACPPSNSGLTTESLLCESQYDWTHPLPTDNCGVTLYDYRIVNPDGTLEGPFNLNALLNIAPGTPLPSFFDATFEYQLGSSVVTYYAEDAQGNYTTCSFLIRVSDDDPPRFINCSSNTVIQNAESDLCDAYVGFAAPLATDNCDIPAVTQIDNTGLSSGSRFPVGTTVMYWEAIDLSGNRDTCQLKVIVNDYWPVPGLVCPADVVLSNDLWLN
ncbi:MAG: hypothetical protein RLZ62_1443, partial [Bacteroidota bacterium]